MLWYSVWKGYDNSISYSGVVKYWKVCKFVNYWWFSTGCPTLHTIVLLWLRNRERAAEIFVSISDRQPYQPQSLLWLHTHCSDCFLSANSSSLTSGLWNSLEMWCPCMHLIMMNYLLMILANFICENCYYAIFLVVGILVDCSQNRQSAEINPPSISPAIRCEEIFL